MPTVGKGQCVIGYRVRASEGHGLSLFGRGGKLHLIGNQIRPISNGVVIILRYGFGISLVSSKFADTMWLPKPGRHSSAASILLRQAMRCECRDISRIVRGNEQSRNNREGGTRSHYRGHLVLSPK